MFPISIENLKINHLSFLNAVVKSKWFNNFVASILYFKSLLRPSVEPLEAYVSLMLQKILLLYVMVLFRYA